MVETHMGVPQGGIISPLLSNLVLHEFDEYMADLIKNREKENAKKKLYKSDPRYSKISSQIFRLKKKIANLNQTNDSYKSEQTKLKCLITERGKLKSKIHNPDIIRFKYVRYADD
jgi:retron-type reverse transcriptase